MRLNATHYAEDCSLFSWMPYYDKDYFGAFSASVPVPTSTSLSYYIAYSANLTGPVAQMKYCFVLIAWNSLG